MKKVLDINFVNQQIFNMEEKKKISNYFLIRLIVIDFFNLQLNIDNQDLKKNIVSYYLNVSL